MDAGRITTSIAPASSGAPQTVAPSAINLDHLNEEATEAIVNADRNKSRAVSLAIAAVVNALILVALTWIATVVMQGEKIELVVEARGSTNEAKPTPTTFAKKVTNSKPASASNMATKTITAATVATPISMPAVETFSDDPAFGDAFGTGFGQGGFGSGRGANFFGTTGGGNRIILVIDTSTSMNGNCGANGIEALRREIDKTITSLSPETRFNIICFGQDADGFSAQPVAASGGNVGRAREWMKDYFINRDWTRTRTSKYGTAGRDGKGIAYTPIPPSTIKSLKGTSGGSRMDLALVAAFLQKPSSVFLIADGEPGTARNGKKMGKTEIVDLVLEEAKQIYGRGTLPKVNCISVKGIGEAILKDIAKRFNGRYKAVDPGKI
jgi:hypothetical protein